MKFLLAFDLNDELQDIESYEYYKQYLGGDLTDDELVRALNSTTTRRYYRVVETKGKKDAD